MNKIAAAIIRKPALLGEVVRAGLIMLVILGAIHLDEVQIGAVLLFVGAIMTVLVESTTVSKGEARDQATDAMRLGGAIKENEVHAYLTGVADAAQQPAAPPAPPEPEVVEPEVAPDVARRASRRPR